VAFSGIEKVLAPGGADRSVRLWSVDDGACLSTFTEFSNTIVALVFVSESLQLVTGDSSGCLKVVRVKTGATDLEMSDAHSGQIWNICPDGDGLLTCGVDGKICFWRDNTREVEEQERVAKDEAAQDEQELTNALRGREFVRALTLAFRLRMPNRLRLVVREISESESPALVEYFAALEDIEDWAQWFDYVAKWTTNARWTDDATEVITAILTEKPLVFFTENKRVFGEKIEAMIPYLERHFGRLERLGIQAYAIDEIVDATEL
jgi:U3 small nucleolar RNA-associated protein 13